MKIVVSLGTRPEIIKMASIIKELDSRGADYFVLHTGQHYSYEMDRVFFQDLSLPEARYNLGVGSGSHAEQTAGILVGTEKVLQKEKPDVVLAEGDTNSVVATALAAVKLHIKTGHVEAGLRSYDHSMPEEVNRIVADHCADYLFAPTRKAVELLHAEGIPANKTYLCGNTIVDVVYQNREKAAVNSAILTTLGLKPGQYFLVTVHRQENVDAPARFAGILDGLRRLAVKFGLPVVYPIHPHSRKNLSLLGLETTGLTLIEPVNFINFLALEMNASLVLTDSGGIQEETCILGVPCVTVRDNTERPETLEVGANVLAGASPDRIVECTELMLSKKRNWQHPFGDGTAGKKIVRILESNL